jgi:hypothetical protein
MLTLRTIAYHIIPDRVVPYVSYERVNPVIRPTDPEQESDRERQAYFYQSPL